MSPTLLLGSTRVGTSRVGKACPSTGSFFSTEAKFGKNSQKKNEILSI